MLNCIHKLILVSFQGASTLYVAHVLQGTLKLLRTELRHMAARGSSRHADSVDMFSPFLVPLNLDSPAHEECGTASTRISYSVG